MLFFKHFIKTKLPLEKKCVIRQNDNGYSIDCLGSKPSFDQGFGSDHERTWPEMLLKDKILVIFLDMSLKCFFFSWVLPRLRLWRGPWFSWRNWQWLLLKTRFLVEEELATRHFFISLDAYFDLYNRFHTHQLFFRIWVQIFNTSEGLQKLFSFPLHQAHLIWHFTFSSHFWGNDPNHIWVLRTCAAFRWVPPPLAGSAIF